MSAQDERKTQVTEPQPESAEQPAPKKREPPRKLSTDTLDENPLICRGID